MTSAEAAWWSDMAEALGKPSNVWASHQADNSNPREKRYVETDRAERHLLDLYPCRARCVSRAPFLCRRRKGEKTEKNGYKMRYGLFETHTILWVVFGGFLMMLRYAIFMVMCSTTTTTLDM